MGKLSTFAVIGCFASLMVAGRAAAMDMHDGSQQAVATVKRGIAYIKAHGKDEAYAAFTARKGEFRDPGHYLVVYALDGTVLAHGQNRNMVGRNLIYLRDVDGNPFIQETLDLAQEKKAFWMRHVFTNPATRKVEPMEMYCERLEESVICSGHFM